MTATSSDADVNPVDRFYAIVEQGLCSGCGICESIAGSQVISMGLTADNDEKPIVRGELDQATVDAIYRHCPGTRVDGLPEALIDDDTSVDPVWGPWQGMAMAWAADEQVRHEGSTGGVLTALALYLLDSARVNFVLHAVAGGNDPAFGQFQISRTAGDVMRGAGSRYGPTALLRGIDDVLSLDEPFAVIGKPCDLSALRNLARDDSRVDQQVRYWLTMVCGGFSPPASTYAFYKRIGTRREEVSRLRYRGRGCPGPTTIETKSGELHDIHYLDFWGEDDSQWHLPFRCRICPDGIGESADIAAADSWPGGSPDRFESETDPGANAVIARTAAGAELLDAASSAGALVTDRKLTPADMNVFQPHQEKKKRSVWARYEGLEDEGRLYPDTTGLRIRKLAGELSEADRRDQREGARRRVKEGRASEPRPKPRLP